MVRSRFTFTTLAVLALLFCSLQATSAGRLGAQTPQTAAPSPVPAQTEAPEPPAARGKLTVHITGIRNATGKIGILLFPGANGFPLDFAKAAAAKQVEIDAKTLTADVVFDKIRQGAYAVVVLHDDNLTGKMEYDSGGFRPRAMAFRTILRAETHRPLPTSPRSRLTSRSRPSRSG
jgi:uncharacterized protein (DUF2141 family)